MPNILPLDDTGDIFDWRITKTWEFTSSAPIRSAFPLWVVYGIPMHLLRWIAPGSEPPSPWLVFNTLRVLFFLISFVLGKFVSLRGVARLVGLVQGIKWERKLR